MGRINTPFQPSFGGRSDMTDLDPIIEKGVPIPEPRMGASWVAKMEIGDSVFLKDYTNQDARGEVAYYHRKGWRFATRRVEGGTRVWRVK